MGTRKSYKPHVNYYHDNIDRAVVGYSTYLTRVNQGWDYETSLTKKSLLGKESRQFSNYVKKAKENGISYETFRYRVKYLKWTYKKAATTPIEKRMISESWYTIAEKNGISRRVFRQRLDIQGYSPIIAMTKTIEKRKKRTVNKELLKKLQKQKESDINNKQRTLDQIKFYVEKNLPVPKKYILRAKEYNLVKE